MSTATGNNRNSSRRVVISPTGTAKESTPSAVGTTAAKSNGIAASATNPETVVSVTENATFRRATAQ